MTKEAGQVSSRAEIEGMQMQNADTIKAIICERGKKGVPLERVYPLLYNPEFYLTEYGKIYGNHGAMTPGVTDETVDQMSMDKINTIIEALRFERYRWNPVRRVQIPKKNGKVRPLGLPTWSDKLLQGVIRQILEVYYEPQFSEYSHGFRPNRGCHTALREIWGKWTGVIWLIEGDISGCFDNINHEVLIGTLRKKIHDERFLRLINMMLKAGYMENWKHGRTLSGTPQGGIASPILTNIYLNELDEYVEKQLIPKWTKGAKRKTNLEYYRLAAKAQRYRKLGKHKEARAAMQRQRKLPSMDTTDSDFRRLLYMRYADDFLLGFIGTKSDAEQIKEEVRKFLQDNLKLELSQAKTLVTHARTESAHFLGYEVRVLHDDSQRGKGARRTINGKIGLRLPAEAIQRKAETYLEGGSPRHRPEMENDSDYTIIATYQAEYRGLVNYYRMAYNLREISKLRWVMETSLVKTLANKYKTSVAQIYRKYRATEKIGNKSYKVLRATVNRKNKPPLVATWGGIPLIWSIKAQLNDQPPRLWGGRTELERRLLAEECEYCGSTKNIEVHHIRALKDLNKHKGKEIPEWVKLMAARKRKTMVVCRNCHQDITYGRAIRNKPSGTGFMHTGKGIGQ